MFYYSACVSEIEPFCISFCQRHLQPCKVSHSSPIQKLVHKRPLFQDTQLVIDRYKSGFLPPEDLPFEEQRGTDTTDHAAPPVHYNYHLTAARGGNTVSGNKSKKRGGLLALFSSNKVRWTAQCMGCTLKRRVATAEQGDPTRQFCMSLVVALERLRRDSFARHSTKE